jgi:hypothetical protein
MAVAEFASAIASPAGRRGTSEHAGGRRRSTAGRPALPHPVSAAYRRRRYSAGGQPQGNPSVPAITLRHCCPVFTEARPRCDRYCAHVRTYTPWERLNRSRNAFPSNRDSP